MGEAATSPFRRQVLRDEVRRLERLSGNIQALLRTLRAAIQVDSAVTGEVELLRLAHPSICEGVSPAGSPRPRAAARRETCRRLLLELHERAPAPRVEPHAVGVLERPVARDALIRRRGLDSHRERALHAVPMC